jgi:predicted nuclease of predicted toxin-antitoxin system
MRIKLDENLPAMARSPLIDTGHNVDSVPDERLAGATDAEALAAATADSRLVITLDRGFADIRNYPPGSHPALVVVRLDHQSPEAVRDAIAGLIAAVDLETVAGAIVVYRDGNLRIRRAPS